MKHIKIENPQNQSKGKKTRKKISSKLIRRSKTIKDLMLMERFLIGKTFQLKFWDIINKVVNLGVNFISYLI